MRETKTQDVHPELKELVTEAVQSLARLDADRLGELALECRELNRDLTPVARQALASQARAAKHEMAALARMLQATGANRSVLSRLRELRENRMEYAIARQPQVKEMEDVHGLH